MIVQIWEPNVFSVKYLQDVFPGLKPHGGLIFDLREFPDDKLSLLDTIFPEDSYRQKVYSGMNKSPRIMIQSVREPLKPLTENPSDLGIYSIISGAYNSYIDRHSFSLLNSEPFNNMELPIVMGIINVTPDSFSDGGKYLDTEQAFQYAVKLIESGADIIDIGGESSRPGSEPVTAEEEMERVIPLIEKIKKSYPDAVISVDTTKSKVADAALVAGALIVNDISGGTFDEKMFEVVSRWNCPYIIMHIKGTPKTMQDSPEYADVIAEVYDFLSKRITIASEYGISKIIIDPGIGFGKRLEDNLNLLRCLSAFKSLGAPVLIGVSRKSFIGKLTGKGVNERDLSTTISESISIMNGARIIRTHNIEYALDLKKIFKGIIFN